MFKSPKFQFLLVAIIFAIGGYWLGTHKINSDWKNFKPQITVDSKAPPSEISNVDFEEFWRVWTKIENNYYDKTKLDPQKMLNGAISGMIGSLEDPFTVYLPPSQNEDFKEGMAGQFQGIGAELGYKDKQIIVISPLNGSPAQKAGIKAGDSILAVDEQSTAGWTLNQAVEKIRGPKGSTVTLAVLPKDGKESKDIKITRDVITVKSVESSVKKASEFENIKIDKALGEKKVIYITLSQFGDNTNTEWLAAINDLNLKLEDKNSVEGVILDLRNNPGGYLTDAVFIASEFVPEGADVVVEEDPRSGKTVLKANRKGYLTDVPVIVLINKGSASASEIVAGALRDNDRAILIGETSFGKGTIQQAEDLGRGAGLHITIAKWLTPDGTWVNGQGLKPDIEVKLSDKEPERDTQLEKAVSELIK